MYDGVCKIAKEWQLQELPTNGRGNESLAYSVAAASNLQCFDSCLLAMD